MPVSLGIWDYGEAMGDSVAMYGRSRLHTKVPRIIDSALSSVAFCGVSRSMREKARPISAN